MAAITVCRQLGSLGTRIGREVAARLGYRLVWREVVNRAALRAGVPEMALAAIDDLGLLGLHPSLRAKRAYQRAVRHVMRELAAEGDVVIIGQAAQVILADRSDVLHVRVFAPRQVRIERVASLHAISLDSARAQVGASDRTRREYLRRWYRVDWDDSQLYDLVLNTEQTTVESAADVICQAMRELPACRRDE